jgi:hypothetical protein
MNNLKKFIHWSTLRIIGAMALVTAGMVMARHIENIPLAVSGFAVMLVGFLMIPGLFQNPQE